MCREVCVLRINGSKFLFAILIVLGILCLIVLNYKNLMVKVGDEPIVTFKPSFKKCDFEFNKGFIKMRIAILIYGLNRGIKYIISHYSRQYFVSSY